MLIQMLAAVAEFERARIRERIRESNAERKRRGLPVNQQPPYGFKLHGPPGMRRIVKDHYTRQIGAKILEWHLAGWSRDAIYLHLLKHRIKTRLGKEWSEGAIARAIRGEMVLQKKERVDKTAPNQPPGNPSAA
jgi:DNA invertase Pin-like site-specific DNA recombinase